MDPNTATREEFTNNLVDTPIPEDATQQWRAAAENLQDLLKKLAFHPAMRPNLTQTYMTPAATKNKVYFLWDFVGRTLGILLAVTPSNQSANARDRQGWEDVISRNALTHSLVLDTNPGMLDMMVDSTYPGQTYSPVLGDDVVEAARRLQAV